MVNNGKKSVQIRVHPEIALIIKKTAEIFNCTDAEASKIIFKPYTLPLHDLLKLSTRDVELRVVFNPKK